MTLATIVYVLVRWVFLTRHPRRQQFPGVRKRFGIDPPFPPTHLQLASKLFGSVVEIGTKMGKDTIPESSWHDLRIRFHTLAESILTMDLTQFGNKSDDIIYGGMDLALLTFCILRDGSFRPDISAGSLEIARQRYGLRTVIVHTGRLCGEEYSEPTEEAAADDDDAEMRNEYEEYVLVTGDELIAQSAVLAQLALGPEDEECLRLDEDDGVNEEHTEEVNGDEVKRKKMYLLYLGWSWMRTAESLRRRRLWRWRRLWLPRKGMLLSGKACYGTNLALLKHCIWT